MAPSLFYKYIEPFLKPLEPRRVSHLVSILRLMARQIQLITTWKPHSALLAIICIASAALLLLIWVCWQLSDPIYYWYIIFWMLTGLLTSSVSLQETTSSCLQTKSISTSDARSAGFHYFIDLEGHSLWEAHLDSLLLHLRPLAHPGLTQWQSQQAMSIFVFFLIGAYLKFIQLVK